MKCRTISAGLLFGLIAHAGVANAAIAIPGPEVETLELQAFAELGDLADAQFRLGAMYDEGLGVAKDDGEAASWYLKTAEQGVESAKVMLGHLFVEADDVATNPPQIYVSLQLLAVSECHGEAAKSAELLFERMDQDERIAALFGWESELADESFPSIGGSGGPYLVEACERLKLVAMSYNREAAGILADELHDRMSWLQRIQAYSALGAVYETGQPGMPADQKSAVERYRMAADLGDPDSQYKLGSFYDEGNGVTADAVLAYAWLNLAAMDDVTRIELRNEVLERMTREEISQAQALSRELEAEIASRLST